MSERVIEFELAIHHSPSRYTNPAASRASRKFRTEAKSAVWRGAICTKAKTAFQPLASQSFPLLPALRSRPRCVSLRASVRRAFHRAQ